MCLSVAVVYCPECHLNLCRVGDCDGQIHKPNKTKLHQRIPLPLASSPGPDSNSCNLAATNTINSTSTTISTNNNTINTNNTNSDKNNRDYNKKKHHYTSRSRPSTSSANS